MVNSGTITSSPGPTPSARRASVSAAVPDEQATPCATPFQSAKAFSNRCTYGPWEETHPSVTVAVTYSSSRPDSEGRETGYSYGMESPLGLGVQDGKVEEQVGGAFPATGRPLQRAHPLGGRGE